MLNNAKKLGGFKALKKPVKADIYLICVPTPFNKLTKTPDVSHVFDAVESITDLLKPRDLIVVESTCPVGTTEKIYDLIGKQRVDLHCNADGRLSIHMAYCPERILPGNVFNELKINSRIVGGMTRECGLAAQSFYKTFVKGKVARASSTKTAELAKLSENAFRDVNIAFANELANIADDVNVPIWELISLCNLHPRVNILEPGPGVGGHCVAVDPWFIVAENSEKSKLIQTAREVNDLRPTVFFNKIVTALRALSLMDPSKKTIIFYGISYKPNIDDLRESPALEVVRLCKEKLSLVNLKIVEPNLANLPKELSSIQKISLDKIQMGDIHVMLVDHKQFLGMKKPKGYLIDARRVWSDNNDTF